LKNNLYQKNKTFKGIIYQLQTIGLNLCSMDGNIGVPQKYITRALNNFHHGFVYRDKTNRYKEIVGFVLWKNISSTSTSNPDMLYITLICGKGLGVLIFNDVEDYAINNNIKTIILNPINDKVKQHYMNTYGFKLKGRNKHLGNVYYKNIKINNIQSTKYRIKNHMKNTKATLKRKKLKTNNNINNFISSAQSKSKSIVSLANVPSSEKRKTFKNLEELEESNYFNNLTAVNEFK